MEDKNLVSRFARYIHKKGFDFANWLDEKDPSGILATIALVVLAGVLLVMGADHGVW